MSRDGVNPGSGNEGTPASKTKAMSSNLMNMKFMQRGRDTELTAMLKQQQAQEISDQQWHLSIIKEDDHFKEHQSRPNVKYESSYGAFQGNLRMSEGYPNNLGRKTFGGFIPDLDKLIKEAKEERAEIAEDQDQESLSGSKESRTSPRKGKVKKVKRSRVGEEQAETGQTSKRKKIKEKVDSKQ